MKRFLTVQPLFTMQQSHQQVIVMLEPAFCSGHNRVINLLCDMLRAIYTPFPVPSATQPAELPKEVHVSPACTPRPFSVTSILFEHAATRLCHYAAVS